MTLIGVVGLLFKEELNNTLHCGFADFIVFEEFLEWIKILELLKEKKNISI